MKKMGLILVLAMLLGGCGTGKEAIAIPVEIVEPTAAIPTPLEVFEMSVVTKRISFIQGDGKIAQQPFYKDYCEKREVIGVSYDVRETDSLVTPLTGYVVYTYTKSLLGTWSDTVTLHYSYQGGIWVYKSMEAGDVLEEPHALCKIIIGD